jgi:hypothetical protein
MHPLLVYHRAHDALLRLYSHAHVAIVARFAQRGDRGKVTEELAEVDLSYALGGGAKSECVACQS